MEGFGVYQVPDQAECEQAVLDAIESGYRLIDTAAAYMNEEAVGKAIAKCGVPREELFITTKLWVQDAGYEAAKRAIQRSLDKLGLEYLEKISDACYLLREAIEKSGEEVPQMVLGYEVYYFKGISQANFINLFTIGNSSYILLELPTRPLTNADVEDIYRIRANQGLTPILAHVERYLAFEHFDFLQDMIRQGELLAQVNADSLLRWSTRKKALEFLKSGSAQFVGSDAHNIEQRAPHLGEAIAMIEKKAGKELVQRIDRDSEKLIQECLK